MAHGERVPGAGNIGIPRAGRRGAGRTRPAAPGTLTPDGGLDPGLAPLALRLHFLFSASRLGLLPLPLSALVGRLASAVETRDGSLARLVGELGPMFIEMEVTLGLADLDWPSVASALPARMLEEALGRAEPVTEPRAAAEGLGQFCQSLLIGRRASGSYYTPAWVADAIAETVVRGVLAGRGAAFTEALSLRLLDPAVGAGAFPVAAIEAIAANLGEGRDENDLRRAAARDCIFGIELHQLAAEACRLAVWLTASRPERWATVPRDHIAVAEALAHPPRPRSFDMVLGNPPWGVKLEAARARRLAAAAPEALSGHRDSYLFFLQLAADSVRDDGALGLLLPDTVLYQVRYQGMRRALLERFRPLRVALLGEAIFPGATAPACLLCLAGRETAPDSFPTADLRRLPRPQLPAVVPHAGSPTPRDAPTTAQHYSFLLPPTWLREMAARLSATLPPLGDPELPFRFQDVGINYPRAEIGRAVLYSGARDHPDDTPVVRGRDFGPFTPIAHSAWLRHDWQERVGSQDRASVRAAVYQLAPKLLFRQTGDRPVATLDRQGVWFGRSVIAVTAADTRHLLWLVGLFNSRAFAALYRAVAPEAGRSFAQVKVSKLKLLPVPLAGREELAALTAALLNDTDQVRRQSLVRQLDAAAYRAYGLGQDEIAAIEQMAGPCLDSRHSSASGRARRGQREATS